ncbi:MAG: DUF4080 domain-containing protein [Lentisphaeria bacterium]|nr:DUF4080 domain-containing protein [Lentisphaeria bacterium]
MKLVWLSVNCSHSHVSLALPLLNAAAAAADWEWREIACVSGAPAAPAATDIVSLSPDCLLATCYLFTRETVFRICRRVKALSPATVIVLGGPEFLGDNRAVLSREGWLDGVVRGEGEGIISRLLETVATGGDLSRLPGVCARLSDGTIHDTGAGAPPLPFDQLPDPTSSPFFKTDRPFAQLEVSRGCPCACGFCTSGGTPVRAGDIGQLVVRLECLRDRGVREVRMLDRTFNASPRRCVRLLTLFRERFPDLRFHIEIHPGFLTEEIREALCLAPPGQLHIEAGVQTSDPVPIGQMGRQAADAAWEGMRFLATGQNWVTHVDFIAGLPGQTLVSLLADVTAAMAEGPAEIQLETLKVLPGTRFAENCDTLGLVHAPDPPYEVLRTAAMPVEDLRQAENVSKVIDRFYNTPQLRQAFRQGVKADGVAFLTGLTRHLDAVGGLERPMALAGRLRIAHDYAVSAGLVSVAAAVEYAWLRWGLSPQHGLRPATLWKEEIPESAVAVEGEWPSNPVKIWRADIHGDVFLFVFHRHVIKQPAQAVFQVIDAPHGD